jgi:DNA/RNA-binding domain of Phe-tRNA-synthetase-like protein
VPADEAREPVRQGVDPLLEEELPGLRLWALRVRASPGPSHPGLAAQLALLSDRVTGATAMALRERPVPRAYRAFFRQVGLDPDRDRTPIEQAMLDRLQHGGFRSRGLVEDALLIALVETGVPVWALDGDAIDGELVLRLAREDDAGVVAGRMVIVEGANVVGELFGPPAADARVHAGTQRMRLVAVAVGDVPELSVHEALHGARSRLTGA